MPKEILEKTRKFPKLNILIIGDILLDKFSWGEIEKINPGQPAAPLVKMNEENYVLGGAANVANNIKSLGANAFLMGVLGKDQGEKIVSKLCKKQGIKLKSFFGKNPTIVKQRIMAHGQQVARLDFGESDIKKIGDKEEKEILKFLKKYIEKFDAIILSDYDKITLTKNLSKEIINLARSKNILTVVDPKPKNISYFENCSIIAPNKKEAIEISGLEYRKDSESLKKIGEKLCEKIKSKHAIVTCGEDGVFTYSKEGRFEIIETKAREVANVTGAGDTFIASLALGMASGLDLFNSTKLANYAAGVVVEKVGTATVSREELEKRINEDHSKAL